MRILRVSATVFNCLEMCWGNSQRIFDFFGYTFRIFESNFEVCEEKKKISNLSHGRSAQNRPLNSRPRSHFYYTQLCFLFLRFSIRAHVFSSKSRNVQTKYPFRWSSFERRQSSLRPRPFMWRNTCHVKFSSCCLAYRPVLPSHVPFPPSS